MLKWVNRFKAGEIFIDGKLHSGRPVTIATDDNWQVYNMIHAFY